MPKGYDGYMTLLSGALYETQNTNEFQITR